MRLFMSYVVMVATLVLGSDVSAQQAGRTVLPGTSDIVNTPPDVLAAEKARAFEAIEAQRVKREAAAKAQFQTDLGISDNEMAVIWPKRDAISNDLYFVVSNKAGLALPPQPWMDQSPDYLGKVVDLAKALTELDKAAKDSAATPEQLESALETVRQLEFKHQIDLQADRNELRKALTVRQEAVCAVWGLLDIPASDAPKAPPTTLPAMSDDEAAVYQRRKTNEDKMWQKEAKNIMANLAFSDADASALQPMIQKCDGARSIANASINREVFGVGRRFLTAATLNRPELPPRPPLPALTMAGLALQDLDRLLQDKEASIAAIQGQMQVVRQEQQKAMDDYLAARTELRSHVTHRQEAMLFLQDVLD